MTYSISIGSMPTFEIIELLWQVLTRRAFVDITAALWLQFISLKSPKWTDSHSLFILFLIFHTMWSVPEITRGLAHEIGAIICTVINLQCQCIQLRSSLYGKEIIMLLIMLLRLLPLFYVILVVLTGRAHKLILVHCLTISPIILFLIRSSSLWLRTQISRSVLDSAPAEAGWKRNKIKKFWRATPAAVLASLMACRAIWLQRSVCRNTTLLVLLVHVILDLRVIDSWRLLRWQWRFFERVVGP